MRVIAQIAILGAWLASLTGCQTSQQFQNSSVVDYLYPKSQQQEVSEAIPKLTLPLKVGIAFTPDRYTDAEALTESHKMRLLERISGHFDELEFVEEIEMIPSGYLRPGGSFENLDQLQRMFDLDVIALVSYDQTRFTDESLASIAYWTLVGAYLVPAEKNATHTMMDTVLYDIGSRQLLFRAPGTSAVKSSATLVGLGERLREDSLAGFDDASEDLIVNLELQLEQFQKRLKEEPGEVQIARREGYSGSGSSGLLWLLAIAVLLGSRRSLAG